MESGQTDLWPKGDIKQISNSMVGGGRVSRGKSAVDMRCLIIFFIANAYHY